jgi:hypothetical protein
MRKFTVVLVTALAALASPMAYAQAPPDDDLEGVEMDVMDANGTPNDASTKVLALPDDASPTAVQASQFGLDTANQAREGGAAFGQATAEAAREGNGPPIEPPVPPGPPEDPE